MTDGSRRGLPLPEHSAPVVVRLTLWAAVLARLYEEPAPPLHARSMTASSCNP